jgi:HAD superfamily hydrolase (TIGR01484 family)
MTDKGIVVLDVDGVLAPHGHPVSEEVARLLKKISNSSTMAFASGKPSPYLEGLARGIGLRDTIIVGENGGVIYIPQKKQLTQFLDCNDSIKEILSDLKMELEANMKNSIIFQQNLVNITIFPKNNTTVSDILEGCNNILSDHHVYRDLLKMYIHVDSIDLVPKGLDKSWALEIISNEMAIPMSRFIAVGDGINDLEMLNNVNLHNGLAICVGNNPDLLRVSKKNFQTGSEALICILNHLNSKSQTTAAHPDASIGVLR